MGKLYSFNNNREEFNKKKDSYIILFKNGFRKFYTYDQITPLFKEDNLVDVFEIDDDVIEKYANEDSVTLPKSFFIDLFFDDKVFRKEEEKTIMNIEIEDTNYMDLSDFITYSPKALKLEGSNITVKGFALLGESYVPDGYFVLGKYGISCCTADAMFTGFIVKTNTDIISNDSWFEINGKLVKGKDKEGYDILYIEPSEVKRINENSEESYVYPCYSYGDDNCQKLMKYGFGL